MVTKHILCFGDSNTWGFDSSTYNTENGNVSRMPFEVRWPGAVQNILGNEYRIIEDALNARTCVAWDPYTKFRRGIISLEVALDAHTPLDLVIIHLGVNELKHYFNLSAGLIADGVEKLVIAAKQSFYGYSAPKVLLIAPPPVRDDINEAIFGYEFGPYAAEKSRLFADLYRAVSVRHGCGFIDCGKLDFKLNARDGLHYDQSDHAKLAAVVAIKIKEIIG